MTKTRDQPHFKVDGQALVRQLVTQSDVLIENFKVCDLQRYGLDYPTLRPTNPRLIYCSVTGFGPCNTFAIQSKR